MAEIKCPTCGAGIDTDGKFCKFCGTKLPDDTQRIEVSGKIDHNLNFVNQARIVRIEKKAELEKYKLENMERINKENRKEDLRSLIWTIIALAVSCGLLYFITHLRDL